MGWMEATIAVAGRRQGSPQLVDYCLKTLGTRPIDGMTVAVRCNSETNTLEYRLVINIPVIITYQFITSFDNLS